MQDPCGLGVLCGTLHEFVKGLKILVVVFTFPHGIIQPATSAAGTDRAVSVWLIHLISSFSSHSTLSCYSCKILQVLPWRAHSMMQLMMQLSCFVTVSPLMPKSLQIALTRGSISAAAQRATHRVFLRTSAARCRISRKKLQG